MLNKSNVVDFTPHKGSTSNSVAVLGDFVREGITQVNTHYCKGMPSGHFEARTVSVQMAKGMYQFHDLLASHGQTSPRKGDLCTIGM